jgi:hypothetical protein
MVFPALQLTMVRGKTGVFFLSVFQFDGVTPQNLSGTTLWFHTLYLPFSFSVDKHSPASGITIQNLAGGTNCATLQLEPADTAALPNAGVLVIPCELVLQNGAENYLLNRGTLEIDTNVGTP